MFLRAIALTIRFAQVWNALINMGFQWLMQVVKSVQEVRICYNACASRKCTLKTKYGMLYKRGRLQNLWNPFRDWNIPRPYATLTFAGSPGYKTSETLLGIETKFVAASPALLALLQNLWNPFRDWNTTLTDLGEGVFLTRKLQNLWNPFRDWNSPTMHHALFCGGASYKTSETLLGIETKCDRHRIGVSKLDLLLQNLWNPFRDWNLCRSTWFHSLNLATKPLKPF